MLLRPKLTTRVAVVFALAALPLLGCSSSQPRDINYGTDAGLGFVPPEGGTTNSAPDGVQVDTASADTMNGADAAGDSKDSLDGNIGSDGGVSDDGSTDTSA
jgi:hypothetical protein